MWTLSTIAKQIARIALAVALAVAPVVPAAATCMPSEPKTNVTAGVAKQPCDMPCKECSHGAKKSCQRDCVVVTTGFIAPRDGRTPAVPDARVDPEAMTTTHALVHPPDTPPPRFLLAQF